MKLITRLKAKETQIGKILAYYLPTIVVIVAGTLEVLQALHLQEIEIPIDLKKWIGILTVISLVLGKLTAKKDETN
jgi:hypothetical protein